MVQRFWSWLCSSFCENGLRFCDCDTGIWKTLVPCTAFCGHTLYTPSGKTQIRHRRYHNWLCRPRFFAVSGPLMEVAVQLDGWRFSCRILGTFSIGLFYQNVKIPEVVAELCNFSWRQKYKKYCMQCGLQITTTVYIYRSFIMAIFDWLLYKFLFHGFR